MSGGFSVRRRTLDTMKQIVILAVIVVVGVVIVKLRSDAAGQRKAVLARLANEAPAGPEESPTALLFREVGAPLPGETQPGEPQPGDAETGAAASDPSVSGSGQ